MKKLLALKMLVLAALCLPAPGICQTSTSYDLGLSSIKEKISTQLEKIKATREYTDNQITLAKSRVQDEVLRSQEQLALQLESLDLLKQDLQAQSLTAENSIQKMTTDLSSFSVGALKEIEDQIALTKTMLERLQSLKGDVSSDSSSAGATNTQIASVGFPLVVAALPTNTNTTVVTSTAPVTSGST